MEKNKIGLRIISVCPVLACCRLTTAIIKGFPSCQGAFLYHCALWFPVTHFSSYTSGQGLPAAFSPCQLKETVSNALALL